MGPVNALIGLSPQLGSTVGPGSSWFQVSGNQEQWVRWEPRNDEAHSCSAQTWGMSPLGLISHRDKSHRLILLPNKDFPFAVLLMVEPGEFQ